MAKKEEPKPCTKCGILPLMEHEWSPGSDWYNCKCPKCGKRDKDWWAGKGGAIREWNRINEVKQ